jgi:hypothetical protein
LGFHVYIEPDLQEKLELLCKKTGKKRNAIMREALRSYLERNCQSSWPKAVFAFVCDPALRTFESFRSEFPPEREDLFAGDQT